MTFTQRAIEQNRITTAALVIVAIAGFVSYFQLPRAEDPGFIIRTAQVTTRFPGASPERVEQLVTDKLEKAIQEMPEIDFLISESKTGVSLIFVNIQERYRRCARSGTTCGARSSGSPDLPDGIIGPTVNDEFGDVFGTIVTLTGDGFSYAELKDIADDVRDELLLIPEVAKVEIYGDQEERIFVDYSNAALAELGLSPMQLRSILASRNIINPGGEFHRPRSIVFEPTGNFESVGGPRRDGHHGPRSGEADLPAGRGRRLPGLHRSARRPRCAPTASRPGAGDLAARGRQHPRLGVQVRTPGPLRTPIRTASSSTSSTFQAGRGAKKVDDFVGNLLQAIAHRHARHAGDARSAHRAGRVEPHSDGHRLALVFMSIFGIGIDQMSLAALIIALGMLVDNAIVMSESIMVQMARGSRRARPRSTRPGAAHPAADLVADDRGGVLPIYLAKSSTGEYTAPLFKVVTITLMSSWLLSLTMIPLLCVAALRVKPTPPNPYSGRPYRLYRRGLLFALTHRPLALAVAVLMFVGAMRLAAFLPNIFFPPGERATATATIFTAPGSPISHTATVLDSLEAFMQDSMMATPDREGLTGWATFIGQGGPRFLLSYAPEPPNPEHAYLILNATSRSVIDSVNATLRRFTFDHFPGTTARFDPVPLGPPVGWPIQIRLTGRDPGQLFATVDAVKERVRAIDGAREVTDDWGHRTKKIIVRVNEARARRAGISSQDVAVSLQTVMSGFTTTEYREGTKIIPVTLRSVAADREDLGKIESMNVYAQATGRAVPLKQVADLEIEWQPSRILRRDRLWTVTVRADLVPGLTAAEVIAELRPWLSQQQEGWGRAVTYGIGGTVEEAAKGNASIGEQLPIAGLIIVFLLIGQFNSFRKPIIILLTIPMGLIGVILGLLIARSYMGFMTLLGIISLAGIVINNAIVLLDRIQIERDDNGREPQDAIIEAAQRRLRPILLTTTTTIGGLIPLWLGGGTDVPADGDCHHLRAGLLDHADARAGAGAVFPVVPGELQGLPAGVGRRSVS